MSDKDLTNLCETCEYKYHTMTKERYCFECTEERKATSYYVQWTKKKYSKKIHKGIYYTKE